MTLTRRIVREVHDEPHLEGSRLTVRFVRAQVEQRGLDPQAMADKWDLDVADVYRALTYYDDNLEELRRIEQRREERIEAASEDAITGPDDL